ncbi:Aldolase-type TIM barrel [Cordyceps fumosorosea ARSEF 2679]|uniref:Aldolase-type TIM barrel n=1 Tax=Cordyceps fumosorosea (strain ARSEF 2679) TaxID=1081104 RepID=A0A167S534_CORFA|nr:Aldolase-type TIM barrel [Cordyceps fumosorosea ARSEF 2679]OAA59262.1 Aldolase-type TIM barrel [Cordyceps fumosorosea ARSEF 2679]
MTESRLLKPIKIGTMQLTQRIGMAPLTRFRASNDRVPGPIMAEYYAQRSAVPGTLIIGEGTLIAPSACGGFDNAPGIWSPAQVAGWKAVTDRVHANGCFIYCQLFAMGRVATVDGAAKDGTAIVGPSAIAMDDDAPVPRAMTLDEIRQMVADFVSAAENAIAAGFDGVECHGANGYLVDQFTQDVSNQRDDAYGGSVENRSRCVVEIVEAVAKAINPERVGLRLSPWSTFQGMKMENPIPQFTDVIQKANKLNLAYLHLVESRIAGSSDSAGTESLDFAYPLWDGPLLVAGGYDVQGAMKLVDDKRAKEIAVMFGRHFISNPDLVYRMQKGLELAEYKRDSFYTHDAMGYTDYPFSPEYSSIPA